MKVSASPTTAQQPYLLQQCNWSWIFGHITYHIKALVLQKSPLTVCSLLEHSAVRIRFVEHGIKKAMWKVIQLIGVSRSMALSTTFTLV